MEGNPDITDVQRLEGVASNRPREVYPLFAECRNTFSRSLIVSVSVASKVKGLSLRRQGKSARWRCGQIGYTLEARG
jgi:hypothetical protein